MNGVKAVRFLGWFSLGLGLVELTSPGAFGRLFGMENRSGLLRTYGLREMSAGVGLLAGGTKAVQWLWGRVAGDLMDIGTLLAADSRSPMRRRNIRTALGAVLGITAMDIYEAWRYSNPNRATELVASRTAPVASRSSEAPIALSA